QEGVIAVTVVWGYFSGPPRQREIVEFDIMFDTDYTWGDAGDTSETMLGDTSMMDLQNIATHELGHGLDLDDLYDSSASEETMYGYSQNGETKKRTLYLGDIAGIQELYG
ncbi:MAG: matrixin family metalloprotease, partial [Candidatus Bathyarchaeia archaeon]